LSLYWSQDGNGLVIIEPHTVSGIDAVRPTVDMQGVSTIFPGRTSFLDQADEVSIGPWRVEAGPRQQKDADLLYLFLYCFTHLVFFRLGLGTAVTGSPALDVTVTGIPILAAICWATLRVGLDLDFGFIESFSPNSPFSTGGYSQRNA
jgi:hypothetical protein